jgi:hypothetical protein
VRLALLACFSLVGCATLSDPPPKQPDAPTAPAIVQIVGDQQDKADGRVAAAVAIARENATRPEVVKAETGVALSYLPNPSEGDLAVARARAAKSDQKDYAEAVAYGKKLLASIDTNWAKMEADTVEAKRVSALKDTRIVELLKAVDRAKKDAATNLWSMAGIGIAALGALAMVFAGPRIGSTLVLSGAAIGAFPFVIDSPYFNYIAGSTMALACGLGIYWLWDHVRDSANAPYEPPQK